MSRIVRGNAISLFGVNDNILGYTPSLDNLDLHQKRVGTERLRSARISTEHNQSRVQTPSA